MTPRMVMCSEVAPSLLEADVTEFTSLVILHGLLDFGAGVHHERAVRNDRFFEGHRVAEQNEGVLGGFDFNGVAVFVYFEQLESADGRAGYLHFPANDVEENVFSFRCRSG